MFGYITQEQRGQQEGRVSLIAKSHRDAAANKNASFVDGEDPGARTTTAAAPDRRHEWRVELIA